MIKLTNFMIVFLAVFSPQLLTSAGDRQFMNFSSYYSEVSVIQSNRITRFTLILIGWKLKSGDVTLDIQCEVDPGFAAFENVSFSTYFIVHARPLLMVTLFHADRWARVSADTLLLSQRKHTYINLLIL